MKLIIAIIRPERLEAVQHELQQVLDEADRYRITVDLVEGHGAQEGEVEWFRGQRVRPGLVPRTRLMIAVNDAYRQPAIDAIIAGARTDDGAVGDGKIFVVPLEDCIRIRTGEQGGGAI
ncbi:MAG: P-II family nitrogen regulator [Kofleriaceae bacterium]